MGNSNPSTIWLAEENTRLGAGIALIISTLKISKFENLKTPS